MKVIMWVLAALNLLFVLSDLVTEQVDWSTALSFLAVGFLGTALYLDAPPLDKD